MFFPGERILRIPEGTSRGRAGGLSARAGGRLPPGPNLGTPMHVLNGPYMATFRFGAGRRAGKQETPLNGGVKRLSCLPLRAILSLAGIS
jgi:hypothetical protein